MPHHNPRPQYETQPGTKQGTFGLAVKCSTAELNLLHNYISLNRKECNTDTKSVMVVRAVGTAAEYLTCLKKMVGKLFRIHL